MYRKLHETSAIKTTVQIIEIFLVKQTRMYTAVAIIVPVGVFGNLSVFNTVCVRTDDSPRVVFGT